MNIIKRKNENLLDRFFEDAFDFTDAQAFSPVADVREKEKHFEIDVHLPGLEKKDISIEIKNDILTVSGERKKESKEEKEGYVYYESSFGKFSRSWYLDNIDRENITADYKDGVLKLALPKVNAPEAKKIELK